MKTTTFPTTFMWKICGLNFSKSKRLRAWPFLKTSGEVRRCYPILDFSDWTRDPAARVDVYLHENHKTSTKCRERYQSH